MSCTGSRSFVERGTPSFHGVVADVPAGGCWIRTSTEIERLVSATSLWCNGKT